MQLELVGIQDEILNFVFERNDSKKILLRSEWRDGIWKVNGVQADHREARAG